MLEFRNMKKIIADYKNIHPIKQGVFFLLLISLFAVSCLIFNIKNMMAWNMLILAFMLFCVFNPVISTFQQKLLQYFLFSIPVFIGLLFYVYFVGNFISNINYNQSHELHFIALLIIIFYALAIMFSLIFRGVLHFLENVDNQ